MQSAIGQVEASVKGAVARVIHNPEDQYRRELISAAPDIAPAS